MFSLVKYDYENESGSVKKVLLQLRPLFKDFHTQHFGPNILSPRKDPPDMI